MVSNQKSSTSQRTPSVTLSRSPAALGPWCCDCWCGCGGIQRALCWSQHLPLSCSFSGVGSMGKGNTWSRVKTHKDPAWTLGTVASHFLLFLFKGNSFHAEWSHWSGVAHGVPESTQGKKFINYPNSEFFCWTFSWLLFPELLPILTSICLDFWSSPACWPY